MSRPLALALCLAASACSLSQRHHPPPATPPAAAGPARRHFEFRYLARVGAAAAAGARGLDLWLPCPSSDELQDVKTLSVSGAPGHGLTEDPVYHNRIIHLRVEDPTGPVEVQAVYEVVRREGLRPSLRGAGSQALTEAERTRHARLLAADSRVPVEGTVVEAALREAALPGPGNALNTARAIYDHVCRTMKYSKAGEGWGQGDTVWACSARYGNCTDFHALFISLARSQGIPARFECGFPLPPERGEGAVAGYHCWSSFYVPGTGWLPVDASEASRHPEMREYYFGSLTEDRVTFTTGRDVILDPPQKGEPINFFVYPHAEADGEPVEVEWEFSFRDLD
ncbi:MAG: transglutaminase domain-containing protein [Planctomycetes bacterium]|nr:transglutaminase domain-containing protein [Planctomycetota bacterium]